LKYYYSELLKLEPPEDSVERRQEAARLRAWAPGHFFLHASLLLDALILALTCILDTPGWDQKAGDSKKSTLMHFVQKLPSDRKTEAESLLKEVRSSASYAELQKARDRIIAHSDREMLLDYVGQPARQAFPNLTLDHLGDLLRRVCGIAFLAIDPSMDLTIPDFVGVQELLEVLPRLSGGAVEVRTPDPPRGLS
jgi:hypothetical protein